MIKSYGQLDKVSRGVNRHFGQQKNGNRLVSVPVFGRDEATRTPDPYVPNVVRDQLRYIPIAVKRVQRYDVFCKRRNFFAIIFPSPLKFLALSVAWACVCGIACGIFRVAARELCGARVGLLVVRAYLVWTRDRSFGRVVGLPLDCGNSLTLAANKHFCEVAGLLVNYRNRLKEVKKDIFCA